MRMYYSAGPETNYLVFAVNHNHSARNNDHGLLYNRGSGALSSTPLLDGDVPITLDDLTEKERSMVTILSILDGGVEDVLRFWLDFSEREGDV